jgi:methyl-accepting chemotaxis protein
MQNIITIIYIVILAMILPAVIMVPRQVSKPIVMVAETLKDISEGEGDLTKTIKVNSKDELEAVQNLCQKLR